MIAKSSYRVKISSKLLEFVIILCENIMFFLKYQKFAYVCRLYDAITWIMKEK